MPMITRGVMCPSSAIRHGTTAPAEWPTQKATSISSVRSSAVSPRLMPAIDAAGADARDPVAGAVACGAAAVDPGKYSVKP